MISHKPLLIDEISSVVGSIIGISYLSRATNDGKEHKQNKLDNDDVSVSCYNQRKEGIQKRGRLEQ